MTADADSPGPGAPPSPPPSEPPKQSRHDKWAHRRAEPRPFAFLWTLFLLGGAVLTVLRAGAGRGLEIEAARGPARALLVVVGVGIAIVWPLIRLSQRGPEHPIRGALQDLFVALCPVQAVLWPLTLIGRWGWEVTLALSVYTTAWAVLAGAIVALGTGRTSAGERTRWMLVAVALAGAAPSIGVAIAKPGAGVDPRWLIPSPITAPFVLTVAPGGQRPVVTPQIWAWAGGAAGLGLVGWGAAGLLHARRGASGDGGAAGAPPGESA